MEQLGDEVRLGDVTEVRECDGSLSTHRIFLKIVLKEVSVPNGIFLSSSSDSNLYVPRFN